MFLHLKMARIRNDLSRTCVVLLNNCIQRHRSPSRDVDLCAIDNQSLGDYRSNSSSTSSNYRRVVGKLLLFDSPFLGALEANLVIDGSVELTKLIPSEVDGVL